MDTYNHYLVYLQLAHNHTQFEVSSLKEALNKSLSWSNCKSMADIQYNKQNFAILKIDMTEHSSEDPVIAILKFKQDIVKSKDDSFKFVNTVSYEDFQHHKKLDLWIRQ
jgi:hypothetical protein